MAYTDCLSDVIPSKILKKISDYNITVSCIGDINKIKDVYKLNGNNLIIYVDKLPYKIEKQFKGAIKKEFDANNLELLLASKEELLNRLYSYNDKNDNQALEFFKSILSNSDWEALRASLFLRGEFKNGNPVSSLKHDIIYRFGERGNVIANLCTAGYFEETMVPLYNYSHVEFHKYYDLAVERGITTLFVSRSTSPEEISREIERKIKTGKAYGQKKFHIHGIGKKNTEKIQMYLITVKGKYNFTLKNLYVGDKIEVLVVEILL